MAEALPNVSEHPSDDDHDYLIEELECEIEHLEEMIRELEEKNKLKRNKRKDKMDQLRLIRVLNSFRKRLAEKESELDDMELMFYGLKIEENRRRSVID